MEFNLELSGLAVFLDKVVDELVLLTMSHIKYPNLVIGTLDFGFVL